ncbi:MAG TPA: hypothetical protein VK489_14110 [Ferruginibacter sp.]|nr:hypothetical protein [Ferruginibacter sp.]
MHKKDGIDKLINEALSSVDNVNRAAPKPYLLTRIQARMNRPAESIWEKAGRFIARPAIAFTGLCMLVLINLAVVVFNNESETSLSATEQAATQPDEFSSTVATIYDLENTQP